jgi:hypothetical protein
MFMTKVYFTLLVILFAFGSQAQVVPPQSEDSLKAEILALRTDVDNIKINLGRVENRFKTGIFISTIGYSVVITGGLMLGRKKDELGKALLVAGGATGVTGTILMVDAFRFLGIASGKKHRRHR